MEGQKILNSQSSLKKEEWSWRNQPSWLQTVLQSYSHWDSMVLSQKQKYRQMEQEVKKQQWELDMEQQTGSKSGKEYIKAVYCHPAYLTYMQSTSWETLDWTKHKLQSRFPGEISITSDAQMIPP